MMNIYLFLSLIPLV